MSTVALFRFSRPNNDTLAGLGGGAFTLTHRSLPSGTTLGHTLGGSLIDLAEVVELAESGRVRVRIKHFAFDQIEQAYRALHEGTLEGRAVIVPDRRA